MIIQQDLSKLCVSLVGDSYLNLDETDKFGWHTREINLVYDPNYLEYILDIFKVKKSDLMSNTKKRKVVHARYMCFWYLYNSTNYTLSRIGSLFKKDHTAALHGLKKHNEWVKDKDPTHLRLKEEFNSKIEKI